jgi:hypothetical protein
LQVAYSTSGKTKAPTALNLLIIRKKPLFAAVTDNRLLNEFFLIVLQDVHEWQSGLGALQFRSGDAHSRSNS